MFDEAELSVAVVYRIVHCSGGGSYCFPNCPNRGHIDLVKAREGQNASQERCDNNEYSRAQEDANNEFSVEWFSSKFVDTGKDRVADSLDSTALQSDKHGNRNTNKDEVTPTQG
jgi:hypothetical protein